MIVAQFKKVCQENIKGPEGSSSCLQYKNQGSHSYKGHRYKMIYEMCVCHFASKGRAL